MREKTCCFTGHRELPFWARRRIASNLEKAIVTKIDEGIRFFGAGAPGASMPWPPGRCSN